MRGRSGVLELAANRPLAALVVANGVSSIGDWLYLTAIPLLVFRQTGDVALVGAIAAVRLLPWLLLSMPAGIVTDRVGGPRVLLAAESARCGLMLSMTALLLTGASFWLVLVVAFAAVAAGAFAMPAHGSVVPWLARTDREIGLANVGASTLDNVASIAGPALAGLVIALGGLEVAFALNGLSFLGVLVVLAAVLRSPRRASTVHADVVVVPPSSGQSSSGWRSIARNAARPLTLDAAISLAAGAVFVLPVLLVAESPGIPESFVGIIGAAAGIGGVAGAVCAGAFVNDRPRSGLALCVTAGATGFAALAVAPSPSVAFAAVALIAAALVMLDTLNMTGLQRSTPEARLGRTLGLLHSLSAGWMMLGSIVAGVVGSSLGVGVAAAICAAAVAGLGAAALAWSAEPALPSIAQEAAAS